MELLSPELLAADMASATTAHHHGESGVSALSAPAIGKAERQLKELIKARAPSRSLDGVDRPIPSPPQCRPEVILMVGVNAQARQRRRQARQSYKSQGRSVFLCAADTFRAAPSEQLEVLGSGVPDVPVHPRRSRVRSLRCALRRSRSCEVTLNRCPHRRHRRTPAYQDH